MKINFEKYAQTGEEFLNRVAFELGDENDTSRASGLLRATLHTLRDQSTPEESIQFISQLPMFIKAIYVDGWKPGSHKGHTRHLEDFLDQVYEKGGLGGDAEPLSRQEILEDVRGVIRALRDYVSDGEIADFRHTLPEGLRVLLEP